MAYTITQARPLLTAAELELFDQSRAEPIKALTVARLHGKVTRVRTLRDKYRDLFRRQTVSVRAAPSTKGRSPVGADNERTQRKADILQEVLDRFEARIAQLAAREQRDAEGASRTSAAALKVNAPKIAKAAKVAKTTASQPNAKSAASGKNTERLKTGKALKTTQVEQTAKTEKIEKSAEHAGELAAPRKRQRKPLDAAVLNQHATRSDKAPSDKAPTTNGKAHAPLASAPTDLVPSALRANPLKQAPGNIAIHAHQGASARRAQGKRDSR